MGTASWGAAIVEAARRLRVRLHDEYNGVVPAGGLAATAEVGENPEAQRFAMHAYGAQFAEARVNIDTAELRVPRLLAGFAAGCIMNAKQSRSPFLAGL